MADRYFTNFPLIRFNNTLSVNLFAKIAFNKIIADNFFVYHPYTVEEGERPETIANWYYGDPSYDWIIYFSNDIIDPYHDWYLDGRTFKTFIEDKYQSVFRAQRRIKFFRTNYTDDFSIIQPSSYNALSSNQKKYWNPIYSIDNRITNYERKKEDIILNSNKTISLTIVPNGNTSFITDERVYQENLGITVASGIVSFANSTTLIVDRVQGTFSNSYTVKGEDSLKTSTVSSVNTLSTTIPVDEQAYYSAVSFYDYENEQNEKRKTIQLLDSSYVESVSNQLESLLSS